MNSAKAFCYELRRRGGTVSGWAREHGIQAQTVNDLIRGRSQGKYGEAFRAAVLMGLKSDGIGIKDSVNPATPTDKALK